MSDNHFDPTYTKVGYVVAAVIVTTVCFGAYVIYRLVS